MITARIDSALFVRDFRQILDSVRRPRAVLAAAGRAGRNELVKHFRKKNREQPNKLGGKRQNFWNAVARSTQSPVLDEGANTVTISVTDPRFAQKVFGGVIKAKRVKNLAIPLEPEAYGRSPRVFEAETGLSLFFLRANGRSFLAHAQDITGVKVFYLLTPSVNQQPDPTALPDHEHLARVVIAAAQAAADRQNQQAKK